MARTPCAIIGSGNIGTDLMFKLLESDQLSLRAVVGIDPDSPGLALAHKHGLEVSHEGVDWVLSVADDLPLVFEATSAAIHARHAPLLAEAGLTVVDLTPAAIGPPVVPPVNLAVHRNARNVNMITCGGQATIPIVAAVSAVCPVPYAEIVATIASRSAGPGTRQNIDEFTQTTARGLETIGGAAAAKAIIVLNPAEPPVIMRNTVYCALPDDADRDQVESSILEMVHRVAEYVPGYRLRNQPLFDSGEFATPSGPVRSRVTVMLEVEGAGAYLPPYAGNLDIMTAAARRVGEILAETSLAVTP